MSAVIDLTAYPELSAAISSGAINLDFASRLAPEDAFRELQLDDLNSIASDENCMKLFRSNCIKITRYFDFGFPAGLDFFTRIGRAVSGITEGTLAVNFPPSIFSGSTALEACLAVRDRLAADTSDSIDTDAASCYSATTPVAAPPMTTGGLAAPVYASHSLDPDSQGSSQSTVLVHG